MVWVLRKNFRDFKFVKSLLSVFRRRVIEMSCEIWVMLSFIEVMIDCECDFDWY